MFRIYKALLLGILLYSPYLSYGQQEVKDGPVEFYYPNGVLSSKGIYRDGKPDGYWKTYYVTGILKSEGKRTNFLLDSTWNFYNQSGELEEVINYQLGKRSGYSLKYTYNNPDRPGQKSLLSRELYLNDKKEGTSYYYYNTGELKEAVSYVNGKKEGYSKVFNRDSILITLQQFQDNYLVSRERINRKDTLGNKQGRYKTFFENGTLKNEINYLDDVLHGYYREFDESGKLIQTLRYERGALIEEIDEEAREIIDFRRTFDEQGRITFSGGYREGIPIGIHRFFDTSGVVVNAYLYNELGKKISEGIVDEQGRKKGPWTDFYLSGKVKAKGTYLNNRRSGNWTFYFENGKIEQKGQYLNGRFEGLWIWYYDNGNIWIEESYFNGAEDGHSVEYDEFGRIITEGDYLNGEKDGEWYYNVGDHSEKGKYVFGLKEDRWYHYYPDGEIKFEGNYFQGNPDGLQQYYYEDGTLSEEQYYKNGIREKIWRKYDRSGNIELAITYRNNKEIRINGIRVKLPDEDVKLIR